MIRAAIGFLLFAGVVAAAPVPKELRNDRLVGTWKVVSVNSNGAIGQAAWDHWTIEANGDLNSHQGPDVPPNLKPAVRLIFDRANRTVEYFHNGDRTGSPGIYALEGGILTIAFNHASNVRPKSLITGQGINLWTFAPLKPEGNK